jgi:DNA-binding transcriptional LysR family regulator
MNLRQLRAFQEVMLTGSMTEAARNMGRTQPVRDHGGCRDPARGASQDRLAILTPARIPLSRLARAFAAVLKEEAQSIVSG